MSGKLISATLGSLTLTMVHASAALADHGGGMLAGGLFFSFDSVLLALITALLTGAICYALMVWDPS